MAKVNVNGCAITSKHMPASESHPKDLHAFHLIPYAEALRFELPKILDPEPSTEINGSHPGPDSESPLDTLSSPESPLRLHIIRPASRPTPSTLLPVVVYFHGGAFNFGSPLMGDLASFVSWADEDTVAVAVEYRLGALGFAAGEEEGEGEWNLGLKDQRVAVEWVRRWIGDFWGDHESLTLMGVSAGAHSIGHHILTPEPIRFQRAILESGSATARSVLSFTHPRILSQVNAFKAAARGKPLSTLSVSTLRMNSLAVWGANEKSVTWPFQPVVEPADTLGAVISDTPVKLWERYISGGESKDISVLTGFCSHEGVDFVPVGKNTNDDFLLFFRALIPSLTNDDLQTLTKLYPDPATDDSSPYRVDGTAAAGKGKQFLRLSDAYGHYAYICPVLHTADVLSRAGATVYLYEYAALCIPHRAASHASHTPAVSHEMAYLKGRPGMLKVSQEMTRRWGRFAAGGSMTEEESEDGNGLWWPKFRSGVEEGEMLVFGKGNDELTLGKETREGVAVGKRGVSKREREVCKFWWERMGLSHGMGEER